MPSKLPATHLEEGIGYLLIGVVLHMSPVLAVEDSPGRRVDLTMPLLLAKARVEPRVLVPEVDRDAPPPPSVVLATLAGDLGGLREGALRAITGEVALLRAVDLPPIQPPEQLADGAHHALVAGIIGHEGSYDGLEALVVLEGARAAPGRKLRENRRRVLKHLGGCARELLDACVVAPEQPLDGRPLHERGRDQLGAAGVASTDCRSAGK